MSLQRHRHKPQPRPAGIERGCACSSPKQCIGTFDARETTVISECNVPPCNCTCSALVRRCNCSRCDIRYTYTKSGSCLCVCAQHCAARRSTSISFCLECNRYLLSKLSSYVWLWPSASTASCSSRWPHSASLQLTCNSTTWRSWSTSGTCAI